MLIQLVLSTAMVLLTVLLHGAGLALCNRALRRELRSEAVQHVPALSPRTLGFTLLLVLALFALHGLEIWAYALAYQMLGAVPDLETAVYFSTIAYGSIGFSDHYIVESWRLVSAIEGINGAILIGWSTAFFVFVVARLGPR